MVISLPIQIGAPAQDNPGNVIQRNNSPDKVIQHPRDKLFGLRPLFAFGDNKPAQHLKIDDDVVWCKQRQNPVAWEKDNSQEIWQNYLDKKPSAVDDVKQQQQQQQQPPCLESNAKALMDHLAKNELHKTAPHNHRTGREYPNTQEPMIADFDKIPPQNQLQQKEAAPNTTGWNIIASNPTFYHAGVVKANTTTAAVNEMGNNASTVASSPVAFVGGSYHGGVGYDATKVAVGSANITASKIGKNQNVIMSPAACGGGGSLSRGDCVYDTSRSPVVNDTSQVAVAVASMTACKMKAQEGNKASVMMPPAACDGGGLHHINGVYGTSKSTAVSAYTPAIQMVGIANSKALSPASAPGSFHHGGGVRTMKPVVVNANTNDAKATNNCNPDKVNQHKRDKLFGLRPLFAFGDNKPAQHLKIDDGVVWCKQRQNPVGWETDNSQEIWQNYLDTKPTAVDDVKQEQQQAPCLESNAKALMDHPVQNELCKAAPHKHHTMREYPNTEEPMTANFDKMPPQNQLQQKETAANAGGWNSIASGSAFYNAGVVKASTTTANKTATNQMENNGSAVTSSLAALDGDGVYDTSRSPVVNDTSQVAVASMTVCKMKAQAGNKAIVMTPPPAAIGGGNLYHSNGVYGTSKYPAVSAHLPAIQMAGTADSKALSPASAPGSFHHGGGIRTMQPIGVSANTNTAKATDNCTDMQTDTPTYTPIDSSMDTQVETEMETATERAMDTEEDVRTEQESDIYQQERFRLFTTVLLKYLEHKDHRLFTMAQNIFEEYKDADACTRLAGLSPRLKEAVGDDYWSRTETFTVHLLERQRQKSESQGAVDFITDPLPPQTAPRGHLAETASMPGSSTRSNDVPATSASAQQKPALPPASAVEAQERFKLFTKILLKYLDQKDQPMSQRVKLIIQDCNDRSRRKEQGYENSMGIMTERMKREVGVAHWSRTEVFLQHLLKDQATKLIRQQQQYKIPPPLADYSKKQKKQSSNPIKTRVSDALHVDGILAQILPFMHVASLDEKSLVNKTWKECCDVAVDSKGGREKTKFRGNDELRHAVVRYCRGRRDDVEEIAETYGYPIGRWDVSKVKDFSCVFFEADSFNEDIASWDVSNATDMLRMFCHAKHFNQDLSSWNISNVTDMKRMFSSASSFDGNISNWTVSKVTNMSGMFCEAKAFNGDISSWDVSRVTEMSHMFDSAMEFNCDISSWDVSRVRSMTGMFHYASSFNRNLSRWNVSSVTDMSYMFHFASEFNGDISFWDVSHVADMCNMFSHATSFSKDISGWDVGQVRNMSYMFKDATAFQGNLSRWNVSQVRNMSFMFQNASSFDDGGIISSWNIADGANMASILDDSFQHDFAPWKARISMSNRLNEDSDEEMDDFGDEEFEEEEEESEEEEEDDDDDIYI